MHRSTKLTEEQKAKREECKRLMSQVKKNIKLFLEELNIREFGGSATIQFVNNRYFKFQFAPDKWVEVNYAEPIPDCFRLRLVYYTDDGLIGEWYPESLDSLNSTALTHLNEGYL